MKINHIQIKMPRFGKSEIIILLFVFAALAFLCWFYFFWLIWETKEINLGPTKEARSNQYLAAQRFLENLDIDSEVVYSPSIFKDMQVEDEEIEAEDVIVLLQGRGVIDEQRFAKLLPWIENGGTLIMSADNPWYRGKREEDALFNHLGLRTGSLAEDRKQEDEEYEDSYYDEYEEDQYEEDQREESQYEESQYEEDQYKEEKPEQEQHIEKEEHDKEGEQNTETSPESAKSDDDKDEDKKESVKNKHPIFDEDYASKNYLERNAYYCESEKLAEIKFQDEARPLKADFGWDAYFYNQDGIEPEYVQYADYGYIFAYYEVGAGRIFVNTSNNIWQNPWIACHDHAYLLQKFALGSEKVWFVVNREVPSIASLVWRGIPLAVIACFVVLVLMLWRALVRFGPTFPDEKIARRSFAEHIKASADFLWRNGLQEQLIEQLRKDISLQLSRRNPGFDKMPPVEKIQCLQKHSELSPDVLQEVFLEPVTDARKKDFVFIVNKLKKIKEQL